MLFTFRGLFGIGMGGMWAAGMPLALEQWPAKHRGIASGILQGGYSTGFLLSSLVYQLGYPVVSDNPDWAWRLMLWAGVIPAIVIFFLMTRVSESPLWLEQQRLRAGKPGRLSIEGSVPYPGPEWSPPADRDVVLIDDDGSIAIDGARHMQASGYPRVKALFGGLELYEFSLDPEVVGQETYLIRK